MPQHLEGGLKQPQHITYKSKYLLHLFITFHLLSPPGPKTQLSGNEV